MRGINNREAVVGYGWQVTSMDRMLWIPMVCTEQLLNIKINFNKKYEMYVIEKERSKYDKGKPRKGKGDRGKGLKYLRIAEKSSWNTSD